MAVVEHGDRFRRQLGSTVLELKSPVVTKVARVPSNRAIWALMYSAPAATVIRLPPAGAAAESPRNTSSRDWLKVQFAVAALIARRGGDYGAYEIEPEVLAASWARLPEVQASAVSKARDPWKLVSIASIIELACHQSPLSPS